MRFTIIVEGDYATYTVEDAARGLAEQLDNAGGPWRVEVRQESEDQHHEVIAEWQGPVE